MTQFRGSNLLFDPTVPHTFTFIFLLNSCQTFISSQSIIKQVIAA